MNKKNYKKGVHILTLIMTISILAYLTTIGIQKIRNNQVYEDISSMSNAVTTIVSFAIQDPITGYMNGSGGDCSNSHTVNDISAIRIKKCANLNDYSFKVTSSGDELVGENSHFDFLSTYNNGCKVYFEDTSSTTYDILLSCDLDDEDKNFIAEDTLLQKLLEINSTSISTWDSNAIDFTLTTGNNYDGKLKISLRK